MSSGEVSQFTQTNVSLKVPSLGTVESILDETEESGCLDFRIGLFE
jgi:hypothetical protein